MSNFNVMNIHDLLCNPFSKIGKEWMLVTAGDEKKVNTMTASWGGLGVMWGKDVAFTFIRPQRYTKEFIDLHDTYSLSFFNESYRKDLSYLGRVSGRDKDKISHTDLTITYLDNTPCFQEANLVLICKKLYLQDLAPSSFLDSSFLEKWYPEHDFHTMYVSEILHVYEK